MDQQQAVSAVASRLARALASGLPPPSPSAGEQRGASYSPQEPRTCALLLEDAFRGAVPGREGPEFAFLGALCATPQQRSFLGRLRASLLAALQHGERGVQEAALAKLPEELRRRERPAAAEEEEERGEESGGRPAAEGGGGGAGQEEEEDPQLRLAKRLLRWFKGDFFKWVDSPDCRRCPAKGTTRAAGALPPTPIEVIYGAHRVEAHRCSACGGTTRFPRYGYTGKLLETRSGRCGEWANVFTLIARAVGFEARYVVDWTDHVWTELFIESQQRWVHADPCEAILDEPLVYEQGWGKKLSYCIAFSDEEVVDVTLRYTTRWDDVRTRRTAVDEDWLRTALEVICAGRRGRLPPARQQVLISRAERERERDFARPSARPVNPEELMGRQSGSVEWRRGRGELG